MKHNQKKIRDLKRQTCSTDQVSRDVTAKLMHHARQHMPTASQEEIAELAAQMCAESYEQIGEYRFSSQLRKSS